MKATSRSSSPELTEKRSAEMMEIKWGDKGDEGQSCENMNEVHPAHQEQLLSLEYAGMLYSMHLSPNSITKGNAVTRPDTVPGGQIFTTGTINGACSSFSTPTAAEVPATCLGAALMPSVQALTCVLKHFQSEPSVSHQRSTKGASNDHCSIKM